MLKYWLMIRTQNMLMVIQIGNAVYISYNSLRLCNVRCGSNVIIGAGSVVTADILDGTVYAGKPARYI